ncbi:synaptotagmin-like protein 4 [Amia ocellicauda]|uniref:synaptotagmin-like protein 4 n=1 Tax=Amia ocellicauda TaxID=2972642 RepID=UPI003464D01B
MWQGSEVINVTFLTEAERELILEVLRRDEELRRVEEQRVRRLKTELLEIRRKGAKRSSKNYSERTCGRCQEPLGRLSVSVSQCRSCNHRVCRECRTVCPNGSWVCSVCAKEAELKKNTGDWFYDQRINRFLNAPGHDLVRASLRRRSLIKKRETIGEVLLQSTELNPGPPFTATAPVPSPRFRDLLAMDEGPPPEASRPSEVQERQRSDTESMDKVSLSSSRTDTESSRLTPVLQRKDSAEPGLTVESSPMGSSVSTVHIPPEDTDPDPSARPADEDNVLFKKSTRRTLKTSEYSRPTSVFDVRENSIQVKGTSMGDRSKSVPGLNVQDEEEEEDIDNLVEIHRMSSKSTYSLHSAGSRSTMGSMMSVYSEAGDYDSAVVSGDIVFKLSYDEQEQSLAVLIKECRDLALGDSARKRCNPYVKSYLLPDTSRQSKKKTAIKRNTTNPSYNQTLKYNISLSQLLMRSLQLSVWHYDRFGRNVFLGEVELPLDSRNFSEAPEECIALQGKVKAQSGTYAQYKGELVISLKYITPNNPPADKAKVKKKKKEEGGDLHVLIKEAKNLTAMKAGDSSDSFVKGYLLPSRTKLTKRKTQVVKKTLNPHYDHTFVYKDLSLEDLKNMCLELTVWDREAMSSNDFLGGIRLSTGTGLHKGVAVDWMDSSGEEVCLWQKMMQYPDSWAEGTLLLRCTMGKNK